MILEIPHLTYMIIPEMVGKLLPKKLIPEEEQNTPLNHQSICYIKSRALKELFPEAVSKSQLVENLRIKGIVGEGLLGRFHAEAIRWSGFPTSSNRDYARFKRRYTPSGQKTLELREMHIRGYMP